MRVTKIISFSILAILGLSLLAAYGGRDNVFKWTIQPREPFQVQIPPPEPNYNDASAWASAPQSHADQGVAVFYIHPNSIWRHGEHWNVAIDQPIASARLTRDILPNHVAPFVKIGPVWMPRYRQASLYALVSVREDTVDALNLAYGDVRRAFAHFQETRPKNSPYLIVGMGQGALHVQRLIAELSAENGENKDSPLYGLVGAYLIEQTVNPADIAAVPPCQSLNQSGCFIAYRTTNQDSERSRRLWDKRAIVYRLGRGYQMERNRSVVACVNPLTGGLGGVAPAEDNHGSVAASGLEMNMEPVLLRGETYARCQNGYLEVDSQRPQDLQPNFFDVGALYKPSTYNLFYQALRDDAQERLKHWRTTHP